MRIRRRLLPPALAGVILATLAACSDDGGPGTPAASEPAQVTSSSTTTTEALTPEEEVEAAYLRSWDVYAKAMLDLDPSGLDEAFADEALDLRKSEVESLASAGTPARMSVEHGIHVIKVDGQQATLLDAYINHSVLIDPDTGEPTEEDPNAEVRRAYTLRRIGGTWKVVFVQDDS